MCTNVAPFQADRHFAQPKLCGEKRKRAEKRKENEEKKTKNKTKNKKRRKKHKEEGKSFLPDQYFGSSEVSAMK